MPAASASSFVVVPAKPRRAKSGIAFEKLDGAGDQRAKRRALLLAQQFFAGLVGPGDFPFAGNRFFAFGECVRVEMCALGFELGGKLLGVALIVAT